MVAKLKQIVNSKKIDQDRMYVFFKNNCPMVGGTYDQFSICDSESGDVVFCLTFGDPYPRRRENKKTDCMYVADNGFDDDKAIVGWKNIKRYFND